MLRSSRLLTLSPELDPDEGIIRVGGRLRHAEGLDHTFKHPIVLDPLLQRQNSSSRTMMLVSVTPGLSEYSQRCVGPSGSLGEEKPFGECNTSVKNAEDGNLSRQSRRWLTYLWPVYAYTSRRSTRQVSTALDLFRSR